MQTIIGAGGTIGSPLANELRAYTADIRLVSRKPTKIQATDQLFPADITNPEQVDAAIKGSNVVYVVVGFEYSLQAWQRNWVPFMQSVVSSCKKHNAKLVFFDNIYMYAQSAVPFMTEEATINPPSKKGQIRAQIHEMLLNAISNNDINALIARSADFYGPQNKNSLLTISVVNNLLKGKKAQMFGNIHKIHTYTFTPDAAKATALLGNTPDAYNQVWHLPTTKELLTNKQWIELIAKEMKKKSGIQAVPRWMVQLLGLFMPIMKEFPEMFYQYEQDYIFDSTKFEKRFGIYATTPEQGIRVLLQNI